MSAPSTVAIGEAIIEAVAERTIEAWKYLDAWASLTSAGMLPEDARYALDADELETKPMAEIWRWRRYGGRGLLVMCGAKDSGKTYACARWVLSRHEDGESAMWVRASSFGGMSLDELRSLMRRAARADALVFDDAGAGTMGHGDYFASMLEGLLLERGQRPTIVSGNMGEAEMAQWLGGRVTSRQRQAGGFVVLESEKRLRSRTDVTDPRGRSPRWFEADKLVRLVGCERARVWETSPEFEAYLRDVKPESWYPWPADEPEGAYIDTWTVGGPRSIEAINRGPGDSIRDIAQRSTRRLGETADRLGLDRAAIRARAEEIDESTKPGALDQEQRMRHHAIQMQLAARRDTERRAKVCYSTLDEIQRRERAGPGTMSLELVKPASYSIEQMRAMGYSVRDSYDGVSVYHRRAKGSPTVLKLTGAADNAAAWEGARRLLGLEL